MNLGGWVNVWYEGYMGRRILHLMPRDDLRVHWAGRCWCSPTCDTSEPDMYVHKAMDGREDFEEGRRKLS
jgi:hypothetical protein